MSSPASGPRRSEAMRARFEVHADDAAFVAMLEDDVRAGLTRRPRSIPPKYFYDELGAELFERITRLDEYYLTRAEESMLGQVARDIVRQAPPRDIVELGPG